MNFGVVCHRTETMPSLMRFREAATPTAADSEIQISWASGAAHGYNKSTFAWLWRQYLLILESRWFCLSDDCVWNSGLSPNLNLYARPSAPSCRIEPIGQLWVSLSWHWRPGSETEPAVVSEFGVQQSLLRSASLHHCTIINWLCSRPHPWHQSASRASRSWVMMSQGELLSTSLRNRRMYRHETLHWLLSLKPKQTLTTKFSPQWFWFLMKAGRIRCQSVPLSLRLPPRPVTPKKLDFSASGPDLTPERSFVFVQYLSLCGYVWLRCCFSLWVSIARSGCCCVRPIDFKRLLETILESELQALRASAGMVICPCHIMFAQ